MYIPVSELTTTLPALRIKYNISAEYLADRIGVHRQTIYAWENEYRTPRKPTLDRLNQVLNGIISSKKRGKKQKNE